MIRNGIIIQYDKQQKEKDNVKSFLKKTINEIQDGGDEYFELQQDLEQILQADYLSVEIIFYLKIPKTLSKNKQEMMVENEIRHNKRPDLDNLLKFYLDVGNGVLWSDDKKIVQIISEKKYAKIPFTFISISDINNE